MPGWAAGLGGLTVAELVAPLIPDAQRNQGPALFLEALRGGLSFMSQMAQQRRQSESDVARLAFAERQAQDAHELDKRKLDLAANMQPLQQKLLEEQANLVSEQAAAYADGTATSAQIKREATQRKHDLLKEVSANARAMKLDDPLFQTKNPMEFAKNVLEFGRMYHLSPLPEVKAQIKAYREIADSQKLFLKHGVEDGDTIKGTGNGRQVPAWRIIANINNPETRDQTLMDLEASGYTELAQGFQQFTDKDGKRVDVPTTTRQLKAPIKKMVEEARTLEDPLAPTDPAATVTDPVAAAPAAPKPMPDYGPDTDTPQYPVGTRGKRGGQWFVLTEQGWKPE